MKSNLTFIGAIGVLTDSLIALLCFLVLPFAMHPIYANEATGIQLLQNALRILSMPSNPYLVASLISGISLWLVPGIFLLISILAAIQLLTRNPDKPAKSTLPIICIAGSLLAIVCLFTMFYDFTINGADLFRLMFGGPVLSVSFLQIGWWICAGCLILIMIGSGIMLAGSKQAAANPGLQSYQALLYQTPPSGEPNIYQSPQAQSPFQQSEMQQQQRD